MNSKEKSANIIKFWKDKYAMNIDVYEPFNNSKQLAQIAKIFSPGKSYYYILNLKDISIDFISPSVEKVLGIAPKEVTMDKLLNTALESEFKSINIKERIVQDFFFRFLPKEHVGDYKSIYTYKRLDQSGEIKTMMLQVAVIGFTDDMIPKHVMGIHTDISHLKTQTVDSVTFLNINGGQSYYNIKTDKDYFCAENSISKTLDWVENITKREKEVLSCLAKGDSTKLIANTLSISTETVKSHRKNLLIKSGAANTAELIALCVNAGLIV